MLLEEQCSDVAADLVRDGTLHLFLGTDHSTPSCPLHNCLTLPPHSRLFLLAANPLSVTAILVGPCCALLRARLLQCSSSGVRFLAIRSPYISVPVIYSPRIAWPYLHHGISVNTKYSCPSSHLHLLGSLLSLSA